MKTYQAVTEAVLQELREITGAAHVKTAPHILQSYSEDESGMLAHRQAEVVVFPGTAEEISRIMKLANRRRIPVTPRGAGTGVCGGVVPVYGGIVVSMERLNRILEVRENGVFGGGSRCTHSGYTGGGPGKRVVICRRSVQFGQLFYRGKFGNECGRQ